jgi:hypothetical protein
MSMVTIRVLEELEQVLVSVLHRDLDKGAELRSSATFSVNINGGGLRLWHSQ